MLAASLGLSGTAANAQTAGSPSDDRFYSGVVSSADFCLNLSLGGPRTFPFDSNGDGIADVCSLPYTRREAIARQNGLERLAQQYPSTFLTFVKQECRLLASQDFGDSPADLAKAVCATGALTPSPTVENQPPPFYSGVVSGPSFCANLSLGGPKTYPFDSNGDAIADTCSLPYTRREAIARQNALQKLAARFVADSNLWLVEACAALRAQNADFGDSAADLAQDICQPSTRPGGGGGGPGGGGPGGGGPGGGPPANPGPQAPGAPNLTYGNRTLTAVWSPLGSEITDYDVRYCIHSTGCVAAEWQSLIGSDDPGTSTTATISGLTNGVRYRVQVRAANGSGPGPWSPSAFESPSTVPDAPAVPTVTTGHKSLEVSWTVPADGGAPVTDYDVQYRACTKSADLTCATSPTWGSWTDRTGETTTDTATQVTISGLTNDTAYQVQVWAENRSGESSWSPSNGATPAAQRPSSPAQPATTLTSQGLVISWSAPAENGSAIISYQVRYRVQNSNGTWPPTWTNYAHTGTSTEATISSLTSGGGANSIAYQVQVRATNSEGAGGWSAQPPDAPTAPTLTSGHRRIEASWSVPAANGGAITGYDVRYRACTATPKTCKTSPSWGSWTSLTSNADPGTATSAIITGLTNGTAYQVQVRAANSEGAGGWSASGLESPAAQPPDSPAAPTLTPSDTELEASWTAPDGNGGAIVDYDVRYCDKSTGCDAASEWTALDDTGDNATSTATTATITGLTNDTAYQVQVRAGHSAGDSAWSLSSNGTPSPGATPNTSPPDAPGAPSVEGEHQRLAVSWSAPAINGAAITDNHMRYRACTATPKTCTSSPSWGGWRVWDPGSISTATATTITGLANGTAYQVQVQADSAAGSSSWSASGQGTPASPAPDAPTAPSLTAMNTSLVASWTPPAHNGAAITDYNLRYRACTATPKSCSSNPAWGSWTSLTGAADPGTNITATITGLTNGTAHQVQVRAGNSGGNSAWSPSAQGAPAPEPPDAPAAPTLTVWNKQLSASWTAPTDNNGASVSDYDVQYRKQNSNDTWPSAWTSHSHTGTATAATITGLTNDADYQVRVRASNSAGTGAWSGPTEAAPTAQKPDALAVPTLSFGVQSLTVSWSEPDDNGASITDYDVRYCTDSTGCDAANEWTALDDTGDNATSTAKTASITGLTNGTTYQVQVRAGNSVGDGEWSASATEKPSTVPGAPDAPTLEVKDRSLGVSWAAPSATGGSAVTGYKVGRCSSNCNTASNWTVDTLTGTDTTTTLSGLTNGTAYQVRVAATNRSGDSSWSSSATATPARVPDAPGAPSLSVWNKQLSVSWTAPADNGADISDYDVQYRACTATPKSCSTSPTWGSWSSHSHTGTSTTATITGLTNDTAYQVQVRATNSVGNSSWSASAKAIPTAQKPAAPAAPTLTYGDQSLTATWGEPADNGADISDYDVRYCVNSTGCDAANEWTALDDSGDNATSTATTATVSGLTNGTTYQVQVRAGNGKGDSAWSTSATEKPSTVPNAPAAPSLSVGDQSLGVTWAAPSVTGGADITGYKVGRCSSGCDTASNWTVDTLTGTETTTTLSSLTNGTAYQVRVAATNRSGDSTWSASATATPAKAPDAPSAPSLTVWNKQLTVSWTAPDDNGADISDYDVQYRACAATPRSCTSSPTWGSWTNRTGETTSDTATTVTITGLTNDTAYQVQVRAANSVGDSSWSSSATATPTAQKPAAPAAPTLSFGVQSLDVSWSEPADNGADITDYDVRYCTNSTGCDAANEWTALDDSGDNATSTATTASITGLTNGTTYQVQVRAGNSVGDGEWSASATEKPSTVPGAPDAPTLSVGDQSLGVSWAAPSVTGGSAISGYKVRHCDNSTGCDAPGEWTAKTLTGTDTTTTLSSLTNGTTYQVQVAATNRSGDSSWSSSATATPARVPDAPSAPSLSVWNKQLSVSWTPPASNGGAITDYDVQYRACTATPKSCSTSPTWGSWSSLTGGADPGTTTTATITGLTNDTAYQVQVRATNSIGDGAWSASAKAIPTAQKPAAPATPTLTYGDQSLTATWAEPADNGADISDYDVRYCVNSTGCDAANEWTALDDSGDNATSTATTATFSGLTNGTTYQVQVRAGNSVGDSAWSTSASEKPSTVPNAPGAPTLSVGDQSLGVTWAAPSVTGGSAVTGYKVGRCSTGCDTVSNWTVATLTGTETTTTLSSLTNGTAYQVRVAATNRSGDSSWSSSATATPAKAPDAPSVPSLTVWNKQLTVSWAAPSDNGADISDYDVQYRACTATPKSCTSSPTWGSWSSLTGSDDPGTSTTATITGLTNDTAYEVQVRATNSVGDSSWSSSATASPTAQKPDAPAAPTLTYGDQSLTATWSAPTDNGADITDYDVRYCTNSTGCDAANEWTALNDTGNNATSTATTATISSLTNGTTYQVQVRAGNSKGDGAWSTSATEKPSTVPNAPAVPILAVKNQSLGVSWSAPSVTGGADITGYKVRHCDNSTGCDAPGEWTAKTLTGTDTTTTLTTLTNGTTYQVQVAATNRSGDSTWSSSATATPARVPDAPSPSLSAGNKQLSVSWTAPADNGSDISDYDVQYRACTATPKSCASSPTWGSWTSLTGGADPGTTTTATITGLTNDTAYQVQVRATNSIGDGAWSASAKATPTAQKPDTPTAPTLSYGDQSLTATWAEPADNGADISDYDVRYCTNSTGCDAADEWTALDDSGDNATSTATTVTVSGLTNGTTYQVQVRAGNSKGDSGWSTSATEKPSTVPHAPAAPTLSVGDQSLGVSWSAPSVTGGADITDYDVRYCTNSTGCDAASEWTALNDTGNNATSTATTATVSGLTNGTAYQVQVRAGNRSGDSSWSTSATATPAKAPDAPSAPSLTVGNQQLSVSWTAPDANGADISDYDVQYRACTATPKSCTSSPTWGSWTDRTGETTSDTATKVTITGLTNDTAYQVQVRAANSVGDSSWSASAKATPTAQKPDAPAAPTLTYGDQSLTATWAEPADNGADITDYDVRYCTNSTGCDAANEWTALDDSGDNATSTATTATISSLTNGTTYQVQVRATNGKGDSAWSTSATEKPSTVPNAPAAPTLAVKDQSLGVTWAAPSVTGGADITGYKVGRCSSGCDTASNWTVATLTGTETTTTLSSLTNGTAYQVRVAATNRSGDSTWSSSATATPAKVPDAPGAPSLSVGNKQLSVSWTAPASNGADISDYDVQYRACTATPKSCTSTPTWGSWSSLTGGADPGTTTTATITGLTNDTAYQVQVRATNSVGDGSWSASEKATPTAQKPDAPAAPTLTYGDESLTATWAEPADNGADIADYDVRYCINSTGCDASDEWTALDDTGNNATSTATTATVSGLTNGTTYQVQVRAGNSKGDSGWSTSATEKPSTVPNAPGAPTLSVGDQSLGVSWSAPAVTGGADITDYDVRYCDNSTGCEAANEWTALDDTGNNATSTATTATVSSLTNGTTYQVQVRAGNRAGDSSWSTSATSTPAKAPDTPSAPSLTVGNKQLAVSWTAPADNGADISDYDVQYRKQNSDNTWPVTWSSYAHTGTATSATITGLTNDSAYQVQVRATNSVGDSSWSASATATPTAQKPDTPAAPTLTYGDQSLTASWSAPADNGADISDYDVRYCTDSTGCDAANEWTALDDTGDNATSTATTATISSLTNGTTYQVQVRASNSKGDSAWSSSATEKPSTVPNAPAAPTLAVKDQSLGVTWAAPSVTGGADITGYKVRHCDNSTGCDAPGEWTAKTLTGTDTTTTLSTLTNGTTYQVQVAATNRAGDSSWSSSATATPAKAPDAPSAPSLTVWNMQLTASWTAPADNGADISDYDVQYRACTATPKSCASTPTWGSWTSLTGSDDPGTTTTATITGLTNDTAYQVQVRATNSVGDSLWSASAKAIPTAQKPAAPSAPTLTVKNQSLDVSWSAPADNGASISDYDVQYRACTATPKSCTTSPTWGSWTDRTGETAADTATKVTLSGLTNATAYQVQVRASNSVGDGAWSPSAQAAPAPQPPDTPAAPGVTGHNTSVKATWAAPSTNGSAITGYNVQYRACTATPKSCTTNPAWGGWSSHTHADTATAAAITGLTNGTAYQVQVQATSAAGNSGWSDSGSATPAPQPPDGPRVPTLTHGNQNLSVSWNPPITNGSAVTGYNVQYRACTATNSDTTVLTCATTPTWGDWASHPHTGTTTSSTISSLTNGTAYQVQVQATSGAGNSTWSASAKATPSTVPEKPTVTLSGIAGSPTVTRVSWAVADDGGSPILEYRIIFRCHPGNAWSGNPGRPASWLVTPPSTSRDSSIAECSSKLATSEYRFMVQARNANGWGASTYPFATTTVPAAVAASSVTTALSGTTMTVSWTAPGDGGLEITDYDVRYRIKDTNQQQAGDQPGSWTTLTGSDDPGTSTTATISGLTASTVYQVQVGAGNARGAGAWSTSKNWPQVPSTSSPPTVSAKHQGLSVSWTAFTANGAAVGDHDVQYRACTATNGNTAVLTCATTPTWGNWTNRTGETTADQATTVRLSGLTNGTAYQVRVRASNFVGESAWTTEVVGTPAIVAPDAPAAPTLSVASTTSLTASWSAPDENGATITDYDVQYRACTATPLSCATSPTWGDWTDRTGETATDTATSVTLTGLTQATAYQVQVRAANSIGEGAWSPSSTAIPGAAPGAPGAPTVTYKHQALDVSWSAPASTGDYAISDYDVQYRACTATNNDTSDLACDHDTTNTWGSWSEWNADDTSTATTAAVTGLTNGTAYQVQVRAGNAVGDSAWSPSDTDTPAPAPSTPTGLSVETGERSWTASWTAPSGPVTRYEIQYLHRGPFGWNTLWYTRFANGKDSTSYGRSGSPDNVVNGRQYRVRVAAENRSGWSARSAYIEFTVIAPPPTPANVSLTVGDTQLGVSWSAPTNNSGAEVTDHDVQYRACTATDGDTAVLTCATNPTWGDWTEWNASDDSTDTTATITELTNGTAYQVQARSTNSAHDSAWSSAVTATPAAAPATPSPPTLTVRHESLGVSWTAPADNGAAISDYDVQYRACTATPLTCTTSPTWGNWASHTHTGTATTATITGLTNNTAYQVQVRATNSRGTSGWSASSAKAVPVPQKPDAPSAPTVTVWNKELRLSWTAPTSNGAAISDFDVQYRACTATDGDTAVLTCATTPTWGTWTEWNASDTGTTTTATITGLTNDTAYQVQVRAANSVGDGAWSASTKATPTAQKPEAPSAPTLTHGDASLAVAWTAPSDNGAAITGYRVRRCDDSLDCSANSNNWSPTDVTGTGTSTTLSGLTNGTTYQVQVRATNSVGNGQFSSSAKEYPSKVPGTPAAPSLTFGSQTLNVSWSAPSSNGGSAITGYKVGRCSTGCDTASNWTVTTLTGTGTTTTLSGLTNGTTYQVRVAATNRSGDSAWSTSTTESPAYKPARPAAPTVTRGNESITVTWTEPADGGADISDYNVNYREQNKSASNHPFTGSGTTTTITGLTNGKRYQATVQAVNKAGQSDWSPWSALATPANKPSAPSAPTLTHGVASLSVSWSAPANNGEAISDYDVQYRACTKSADLTCASNPTWGSWTDHSHTGTTTTASITGLTNGTAYQVQVRATNAVGTGSWSASAKEQPNTVPGAPGAPTLGVWHASLNVSWSAPSSNGGSAISDYDVQYRACTATPLTCTTSPTWGSWTEWNASNTGTTTTASIIGLTNGTAYQVQVRAANRSGDGAWSTSASAAPAPQKPAAPGRATLTVKNQGLSVSWTEPATNGSAITDYDVQYRACTKSADLTCASSPTWGSWTDRTGETASDTATTVELTGLTNGTAYQVQVRAANAQGESDWSPLAKATAATTPSAPGQPTVTTGAQQLAVSWTAPSSDGGEAITGYKVRYCDQSTACDADDEWTTETLTGTDTTTDLTGLTNGTTYRVQVAATNSVGDSAWSTYRTGIPKDKPAQPNAPTLVSGSSSLWAKWDAPANNGSSITGYKLRYCGGDTADCGSDDSTDWTERSTSSTSYTISGLTNGTQYQVKVRARNAIGDSDWSYDTYGTPGAPAAPSTPSLTEGDSQLTVTWSAPNNRGDTIIAYGVEYCNSTDNTCTTASDWNDSSPYDTSTTTTVSSLTNGKTYKVRVRAQNSRGWGGWSSTASATPATVPDAPDTPTLTAKDRSLDVSWTAPTQTGGSALTGYSVRYCDNSTGCDATNEWTVRTISSASTTTYTISSLTNGKTYQVEVAAKNRKGLSSWSFSASATPAALPSKPTSLNVEAAHQSLRVTWTASVDNGSTISGYQVEYKKQNSDNTWPTDWTSHTHSDTNTATNIDSLTNGSKYRVRVQATSNNGNSGWTSAVEGTPAAVPDAPDTPTLTAGDAKIDISWSEPSNNNGSAVTDYDVRYRACTATPKTCTSSPTWGSWSTISHTGTATAASKSSLTNGTAYQVQVRAQNANGESPYSNSASAIPAGKPAKPSTPTVTTGDQQLTVTWTAPSDNGSTITGYTVQYCTSTDDCTNDDNWYDSGHSDTTTSVDISGLTNGTSYKVRVRATNSVGDGTWSTSATGTPVGKPSAPDTITIASGNNRLIVSWNTPTDNGATVSGFKVRYCNTNDDDKDCYVDYDDWTTKNVSGASTRTTTITGLTNGDSYDLEIATRSSNGGDSDWWSAGSGTPGAPNAPSAPSLSAGDGQITVTWTAPSKNHSDIQYYEIASCNNTDGDCTSGTWSTETHYDTDSLSLTIWSLDNGKAYKVRVRAHNHQGAGAWSSTSTATPTSS